MEKKRIWSLAIEIFKTLHDLNPISVKALLENRLNSGTRNNDLMIPFRNTIKFGDKSMEYPTKWKFESESSYEQFKSFINSWFGPKCKCNFCLSE